MTLCKIKVMVNNGTLFEYEKCEPPMNTATELSFISNGAEIGFIKQNLFMYEVKEITEDKAQ